MVDCLILAISQFSVNHANLLHKKILCINIHHHHTHHNHFTAPFPGPPE